jgi:putative transcriptional regulator
MRRGLWPAAPLPDTMRMQAPDLANHFLIAMPSLADPNFSRTVTYLCEHSEEGALGIVINRPTDVRLGELLDHLGLQANGSSIAEQPVFLGGPVQRDQGFVLHRPAGRWDSSLEVAEDIILTTSQDILAAIAESAGPQDYLVALGCAGWGPGQREEELAETAWLSGPASADIMFSRSSERRWRDAAALLGVDLSLLSADTGRA